MRACFKGLFAGSSVQKPETVTHNGPSVAASLRAPTAVRRGADPHPSKTRDNLAMSPRQFDTVTGTVWHRRFASVSEEEKWPGPMPHRPGGLLEPEPDGPSGLGYGVILVALASAWNFKAGSDSNLLVVNRRAGPGSMTT